MKPESAAAAENNVAILLAGRVDAFCQPADYPISQFLFANATAIADTPIGCITALGLSNRRQTAKRLNRWIAEASGHLGMLNEFALALVCWSSWRWRWKQLAEQNNCSKARNCCKARRNFGSGPPDMRMAFNHRCL